MVVRVISIYTSLVPPHCQYCQLLNPLFSIRLRRQYEQTSFFCASNRISTWIDSWVWDSTYDVNLPLLERLETPAYWLTPPLAALCSVCVL